MHELPGLDDLEGFSSFVDNGTYGTFPCPTELWIEMLKINDLRARQALTKLRGAGGLVYGKGLDDIKVSSHCLAEKLEAAALLLRIMDFVPEEWAEHQDRYYLVDIWTTIGRVFRAAMLLYTTTGLLLPSIEEGMTNGHGLETRKRASRQTANAATYLAQHIGESLEDSAPFGGILFWPLIVGCIPPRAMTNIKTLFARDWSRSAACTASSNLLSQRRCWNGSGRLGRKTGTTASINLTHL
jgi:hypothetical protein